MDFIGEGELEGLRNADREELDKILSRFQNQVIERVLCSIPDMIQHLAKRAEMMNEIYRDLFKECPECKDDKELLASVIQRVEGENPGKSPAEVFKLIPAEYRKAKGLMKGLGSVDLSKLNETVNGIL